MNDESKTKKPSLAELVRLRRRIDELETTNAELRDDREALQEGEGFLARVLNSSPFPFFIVNPDTSIRYAGLALEKLTGFTPEEVIGIKAPYPWWPKDAEKDMKEYLGQAMRHGLYRREIWLQKKDGGPCCVEVSSFPVKERGRLKYYFSAWMDVTERRQTEEAIKRRLDFERTIALASSRLVTITDMEEAINCALADIGEFSGASRAYIFLLCDGGKFMGNTHEWCAQGVSPQKDNLQNLSCAGFPWWMQKLRSNETIRITNVAEMPDEAGAEREIMKSQDIKSLLVLPLWAQDELSGFIGFDSVTRTGEWREEDLAMLRIASDVIGSALRRQQMEAALKESEQKYRLLVENQTDLIVEIDGDWNITFVSPSCCEFFGKEEAELLGKQFLPLVYEEDQEVTARALESLYEPPYTYYVEQQALTKNRRRWLAWAGKAILDEDSKVIAIVCVGRDITEQKRAEEEKREIERKAHLASRLASVGEMAAGIAHEINNPLTAVIGFAQLLTQKDIPEDIERDVEIIFESAQRVGSIVRRLLAFSRQRKPERSSVDITEIVDNTLELRTYSLRTGNIQVNKQLQPDLPKTMADSGQLQQVFLNIIINAETAMKTARGRGKLLVRAEAEDDVIRIIFEDDGPGIPEKNLERIFDPFFTTRKVGMGTGLGLSVCHGIIAEHGGRIYAESKPGKGATFVIELPVRPEEPPLEVAVGEQEPEKAVGASILVVDDEKPVRQFLHSLLIDEGYKVETVDNASDAWELIRRKRYSLILLDIIMPDVSGIELYERLDRIAKSLARRVVFITGDVMKAETRDFLTRNKSYFITKPFDAELLRKEVKRLLTRRIS